MIMAAPQVPWKSR